MSIGHLALLRKGVIRLLIVVCVAFPLCLKAQSGDRPPKVVAVVIDDSGSMDGQSKRWIRANYALKTLVGLLDERDSLQIFLLNGSPLGPYKGRDGFEEAIKALNSFSNVGGTTPYDNVTTALNWLLKRPEVNKGFVVITDGVFNSPGYEKEDSGNRTRAKDAGVHSAFVLIEQDSNTTAENWKKEAGAESFEAKKVSDIDKKLREAATWLNGQGREGVDLKRSGNQLLLDSKFPLRRVVLLRQDADRSSEIVSATVAGQVLPAKTLRQHLIKPNLPSGQLIDARIYHVRAADGAVIEPGKGVISLNFSADTSKVRIIALPDVAAKFSVEVTDTAGKPLVKDGDAHVVCDGASYRVVATLSDDAGKAITNGRTDFDKFTVAAVIGGKNVRLVHTPQYTFSLDFPSGKIGETVFLKGKAEYPGYLHIEGEQKKLVFKQCKRTIGVSVVGGVGPDRTWRADVDAVAGVPPVRIAATVDGKPVTPEEFGRWELSGSDASGFVIEPQGTEWLLHPRATRCCLLFWNRPAEGNVSVAFVRLNTGLPLDEVTLPDPVLFELTLPTDRLRLIWWYVCPLVYFAAIVLLIWYMVRLVRKQRFSSKARFWVHEPASGTVVSIVLRRKSNLLMRWLLPSDREKANVEGMLVLALGKHGSAVIIDGKTLDERYEIDNWSFNENRKEKGLPQTDARLRDGGIVRVMGLGGHGQSVLERRFQYSKSGGYPQGQGW